MILTAQQIRQAVQEGRIGIEPFDERQLEPATYDLRVGPQGVTTSKKELVDLRSAGYLAIAPGDFAIVTVHERLEMGDRHVGRFGLRSKYARKGLLATTGPQIDPGYCGRLTVGLTNLTPKTISLPYKDDLLSVEYHELTEPTERPYQGPFQGRDELRAEDIELVTESTGMAYSEVLTTLSSLSKNVAKLSGTMNFMKWWLPIGLGIIALMVALD